MFERHFGLRENPFVAGHQHRFVYPSPEHLEALAHLRYGIENREPFVLITGEVGTGKTTALYDALSEWESRVVVALITNSALTRAELLEEIALRFGVIVHPGSSKPQIMTALERHLLAVRAQQHRAILLLDEAQNLERELLEEIRLLSNLENAGDNLLQVVLVGQPELEEKLARPELRQLRQRITVHYRLSSLSPEDTERYIQHRVSVAGGHALSVFPTDSCRAIHRLTTGIPREINHLAAQAMLTAYVDDAPNVRVEHVEVAAREIQFKSVSRPGVAGEPPLPRSFAPPLAAEPWPVAMAPPPQVPAEPPAPMPTPLPVPARPEPRSVAPEGPHRTASSAAWDAWMSAIANPADAARQHEAHATAPPSPAPPAYTPPVIHPPIPLAPRARESESDFATRLDAAALAPAAAPAARPRPRGDSRIGAAGRGVSARAAARKARARHGRSGAAAESRHAVAHRGRCGRGDRDQRGALDAIPRWPRRDRQHADARAGRSCRRDRADGGGQRAARGARQQLRGARQRGRRTDRRHAARVGARGGDYWRGIAPDAREPGARGGHVAIRHADPRHDPDALRRGRAHAHRARARRCRARPPRSCDRTAGTRDGGEGA